MSFITLGINYQDMIDAKDIFKGYVSNYEVLKIYYNDYYTKVTRKVLRYFTDLGEILGYHVSLESKDRHDLVWDFQVNSNEQSILHLETENEIGTKRNLENTFPKLRKSIARIKIAIIYTRMESFDEDIKIYRDVMKEWDLTKGSEIMFIISDWWGEKMETYNQENHSILALIKTSSSDTISEINEYQVKLNENGYRYILQL